MYYVSGGLKQQKHNTIRPCEYLVKDIKSGREQKQQYQRGKQTDERGIFLITLGYCQDFGIFNSLIFIEQFPVHQGALHLIDSTSGA